MDSTEGRAVGVEATLCEREVEASRHVAFQWIRDLPFVVHESVKSYDGRGHWRGEVGGDGSRRRGLGEVGREDVGIR